MKRATSFEALVPIIQSNFFAQTVDRRVVVVFTDGEASKLVPYLNITLHRRVEPVYVHVWRDGERIYHGGRVDPNDPYHIFVLGIDPTALPLLPGTTLDPARQDPARKRIEEIKTAQNCKPN